MNSSSPEVVDRQPEPPKKRSKAPAWLKRIGIAGFLFFLFKGLAWLFFGAAIVRYFGCKD